MPVVAAGAGARRARQAFERSDGDPFARPEYLLPVHGFAAGRLRMTATEQGILLTPYDPSFDEAMQAFDEIRRDYRNTLRKLAE
jgi:hypothetical protein